MSLLVRTSSVHVGVVQSSKDIGRVTRVRDRSVLVSGKVVGGCMRYSYKPITCCISIWGGIPRGIVNRGGDMEMSGHGRKLATTLDVNKFLKS